MTDARGPSEIGGRTGKIGRKKLHEIDDPGDLYEILGMAGPSSAAARRRARGMSTAEKGADREGYRERLRRTASRCPHGNGESDALGRAGGDAAPEKGVGRVH